MTAVLQRSAHKPRVKRINKLDVWLAAMLVTPRRATASMIVCIAIFCLLGWFILLLMKPAEGLFMDSTEAYAWGMQFLGGYGRHPPLTGWIARIWYSVFPAANWSSYALSEVMTGVALVSIYLIGRRVLGVRRATLVVFAMMLYPLFIGAKADRFNNYQVLLAVMPLTVWLFLRAFEKPTARAGVALGVAAAAATLTIYSAAFGLIGIGLAALLHPRRRVFFTSPAPYVAAIVYVLALSPHIIWLVHNDFSSLRWAEGFVGEVSHRAHVATYLGQHFGLLGFCLVGAAIALWPWRWRAASQRRAVCRRAAAGVDHCGCARLRPGSCRTPLQCFPETGLGQSVFLFGPYRGRVVAAASPGDAQSRRQSRGGRRGLYNRLAGRLTGLFVGAVPKGNGRRSIPAVC